MRRILIVIAASMLTVGVGADAYAATATWTVRAAPLPADAQSALAATAQAVDCSFAKFCAVVGRYQPAGADATAYVGTLKGKTWTSVPAPLPPDAGAHSGAFLADVTCLETGRCIAVGGYGPGAGSPLIETYEAGTWTATAMHGVSGVLNHVDCNGTECVAVGVTNGSSPSPPLFIAQVAGTWQAQTVSSPHTSPNTPPVVSAVACPQPSGACRAVGGNDVGALEYHRTGSSTWTAAYLPTPAAGVAAGTKGALACAADGTCAALVERITPTGHEHVILGEVLSDGVWTATTVTDQSGFLTAADLDCPSTTYCAGVVTDATPHAWVLTLSDGTWSLLPVAVPADARPKPMATLNSVSCRTVNSCTAVGGYNAVGVGRRPFVVTSARTTWTPLGLPVPDGFTGTDGAELNDISCAERRCTAVGSFAPARTATKHLGPVVATYGPN